MKKIISTLFIVSFASFGLACDQQEVKPVVERSNSLLPQLCEPGDRHCTYTMGWYKNHTKEGDWPLDPSTQLCGQSLLDILNTPPAGDHWYVLAHQWITALLNAYAGAQLDPATWQALVNAESIVLSCTVTDVEQATAWTETLDAFNNGEALAPHCDTLEDD